MSNAQTSTTPARTNPIGARQFNGRTVLGVLLVAFIAMPFCERSTTGLMVESLMLTAVLFSGIMAIGGDKRIMITGFALAIPAIFAKWLNSSHPELCPAEVHLSLGILTVGLVVYNFIRFLLRAHRVDSNVLCTGIAAFLLMAVLWSFIYQVVDLQTPGSFTCTVGGQPQRDMRGMFAIYFSLVTLCTVGFGDIAPVTDTARMCAMLEGATGVFYVAVLISRLVSLYTAEQQASQNTSGK